jgi:hypothetical protein
MPRWRLPCTIRTLTAVLLAWSGGLAFSGTATATGKFVVAPPRVALDGNFAQAQLLVTASDASGATTVRSDDLTSRATYVSSDPAIVSVDSSGRLRAHRNGTATVQVTVDGLSRPVPVSVTHVVPQPEIGFHELVIPVIARLGCNAGACHASQHGKGGFILSVFGYDPDADYQAIVRDRMQRRVSLNRPADSLLLKKPTMTIPHGGGKRLAPGSIEYEILEAWIAAGATQPRADAPRVVKLEVFPERRVGQQGFSQQLQVRATYSDKSVRDVTALARFDTMDEAIATITPSGLATTIGRGEAPVMVRFEGQAEICMLTVPYHTTVDLAGWSSNNFIDELAAVKFQELGVAPSGRCDDATFVRRAYLDAIGTLPSIDEAVSFIDSADPDKRQKLIDRLLGLTGNPDLDTYNDSYAAFWTLKWADLIRNSSDNLGEQGMWSLHNWIRESLRVNKPFDQFVRELVTAQGSIYSNGPANYFRVSTNSADLAEATAQLFLGIRLQCAKCHHHPFEKYGQEDYYSFAAFFSRVGIKSSQDFGLFGRETVVVVKSKGDVRHPRTKKLMSPTPLDGEPVDDPLDRRIPLADWLTSRDNEYFARNVVNRYMGYLLGRGLVEPIDDMRATNPPSNPALMSALAKEFRDSGFNVKHILRLIMNSRLYQLDSQPTPGNATDTRCYSHFEVKRLAAEPLLDAIDTVTGAPTKFPKLPLGTRAIELPDSHYPNYFLSTFGKPKRVSACECERSPDENLSQALHTLNGDTITGKITAKNGRLAQLLSAKKSHAEIITELYLASLSRRPSAAELKSSQAFLKQYPNPKECYQDLLWALLNSKQFLFVH